MVKKIFYILLVTLGVVGVAALLWWWFSGAPQNTTQTGGTFGSAQNAQTSGNTQNTTPTNVEMPLANRTDDSLGTSARNTVSPGTYVLRSGSQTIGTYSIAPQSTGGGYTISPMQGQTLSALRAGSYTLTAPQSPTVLYTVMMAPVGTSSVYTITPGQSIGGNITDTIVGSSTNRGQIGVPGVTWLSGASTTAGRRTGNTGTVFNPTGINSINTASPNGGVLPNIGGDVRSTGSNAGMGLAGAVVGAAAAGAISCGGAEAWAWISKQVGELWGAAEAAPGEAISTAAVAEQIPLKAVSVSTVDIGTTQAVLGVNTTLLSINKMLGGTSLQKKATDTTNTFWGCLARTVARVALNQITNSVVNWINSGFGADGGPGSGSPAFVTNPTQFFNNIANQSAGHFIKGSALSFLCSPFQLQIKIAIAQSYANRNSAFSCTLTKISRNIQNFMRGDFNAGGWPAMLSFTTAPTNNPYGAYIYANVGIAYTVQTAVGEQRRVLSLGNGFLDFKQKQKCRNTATREEASESKSVTEIGDPEGGGSYEVCDLVTTTPGWVIAGRLGATQDSTLDQLSLAKSFDEILTALISQLITRTLQGGLLNLSGQNGYASNFYTPEELRAQREAQTLLGQLQNDTTMAQSMGGIKQGSITDIQSAQRQLHALVSCWTGVAARGNAQAGTIAAAASSTIQSLETRVRAYNDQIQRANDIITALIEFQSRTLSAGSQGDLDIIAQDYQSARSQGRVITTGDITDAQQDRTTLQSQMAALNQQTSTSLSQCNANQPII